ncbi:hypothetical protein CRG98_033405 [Punica granatum]|uniref:Uncharacterized protein n=1 Tax=Punica granatum TaxID=22663 RepID=A0A2I0IRA0_PUNGR|nr:hypothetical protein CRG98_033405 [Punica granatum]
MAEGQMFEDYATKWHAQAVKYIPPINETLQIQLFHYTLKGVYYSHLLAHTSLFSSIIDVEKKLEMGIKLMRIEGLARKRRGSPQRIPLLHHHQRVTKGAEMRPSMLSTRSAKPPSGVLRTWHLPCRQLRCPTGLSSATDPTVICSQLYTDPSSGISNSSLSIASRLRLSLKLLFLVYMLKVEWIAFRFLPDPVQIKNALEVSVPGFNRIGSDSKILEPVPYRVGFGYHEKTRVPGTDHPKPNIQANPLPDHGSGSAPAINLFGICPQGKDEATEEELASS